AFRVESNRTEDSRYAREKGTTPLGSCRNQFVNREAAIPATQPSCVTPSAADRRSEARDVRGLHAAETSQFGWAQGWRRDPAPRKPGLYRLSMRKSPLRPRHR